MNAVIYARVSSAEQVAGYSIEAQIDLCRVWANERGHDIVRVYVEPGRSARTDERPIFQRMTRNVCAGEGGAVIVHKVDRFARNLLDLLRYKKILKDERVSLLSATEDFLNGDSPENNLALKIMGAVAEYAADNIGQEATKGQDAKARAGRWPGSNVPLGYIRIGKGKESKIGFCPDYGPIILESFSDFAAGGYTLGQWAAVARGRGYLSKKGKVINTSTWHNIFRNIFYVGQFTWKGETYKGNHPALIRVETWRAVAEILESRASGGADVRHFWLLRGLLWSEVQGKAMSGSLAKGRYPYYRAKGRARLESQEHNIRAEIAESRVVDLLATIRTDGGPVAAPDNLLLAILSAPSFGLIWPHLGTAEKKREFLKMIFTTHGLHVNAAGVVSVFGLLPGFEIFETK